MKIKRHQQTDGFIYYEATLTDGSNLITFTIRQLIKQLWEIHKIDKRKYLFNASFPVLFPYVGVTQLN